jgi:hypothetical protein
LLRGIISKWTISLGGRERLFPLGVDMEVVCLSYSAGCLWRLGYPDQAFKRANDALALAQQLSHPSSPGYAYMFFGGVRRLRRELGTAQETAEHMIALSLEHGFTYWLAHATLQRGGAIAAQGKVKEGIAQLQEGSSRVKR